MDTTRLGRTGLTVSRLCLGTMNFGMRSTEPEAHAILDRALDRGINFLDTADVYGSRGATEEIVGNWLRQGRNRDRVVLATKAYEPMGDGVNDRGLSARHIIRACEDSLRRLQTDWIDLYQMHHVDRAAPWDEIWQAMDVLTAQGKILYVGSSNFAAWHIVRGHEAALRRQRLGLVSEQSLYNLMHRTVELEVLPACMEYGIAVLVWSPLNRGVLGGILGVDSGGRRSNDEAKSILSGHQRQIQDYEDLCRDVGLAPAELAVSWLLHQPAVTAPIIGPGTLEQLESSIRALTISLDEDVLSRLDVLFPGPGPAPESYAW